MLTYPMTTGRNFDEILRVIDSLQLTAKHQVATPADWKPGEDVIILSGSVTNEQAPRQSTRQAGDRPSPISASSRSRGAERRRVLKRLVQRAALKLSGAPPLPDRPAAKTARARPAAASTDRDDQNFPIFARADS